MVESDGLENRCALTGTVGSNPTLSAILNFGFQILNSKLIACNLEFKIWNLESLRKGAGAVELAALEML